MRSALVVALLSSYFFVTLAQELDGAGGSDGAGEEQQGGGEDPDEKMKTAHAVLGSVAWVFFFPLGSILLRILQGNKAILIHVASQLFAMVLFTASVGLGIRVALDKGEIDEYHCVIGLVLFSVLFVQAVQGISHHLQFRKKGKRTVISYMHIWLGRALITLGMINGGLGLLLAADAENGEYIAYGVVAGCIWLVWMAVDVRTTLTQRRQTVTSSDKEKEELPD